MISLSRILKNHQVKIINPLQTEEEINDLPNDGLAKKLAEDIIFEAEFNAQEISKNALLEAQSIKEKAEETGTKLHEEEKERGYKIGFERGQEEGHEAAFKQWLSLLANTDKELKALDEKFARWQEEMALEIIVLGKEIARRIIGAELEVKPENIVDRVANALKQVVNVQQIIIKVALKDLPLLEKAKESLTDINSGLAQLRIAASEDLKQGDFVLETDMGGLDGRLDTQLNLVHKELVERWQASGRSQV